MKDLTYSEYKKSKEEARKDFKASEYKKGLANAMYYVLKRNDTGKPICADKIADKMSEILQIPVNRSHVNECVRLFRKSGRFPGLVSSHEGYFIDDSLDALLKNLRFVFEKAVQIESTAQNIRDVIVKMYGEEAVPKDLHYWLYLIEKDELSNDTEKDDE